MQTGDFYFGTFGENSSGTHTCELGLSKDCLRQELQEERQRLHELQERNAEMEALFQRLASLDHASSSYVVFYSDTSASLTVTTGHTYASLLDPDALIGAHCYFYAGTAGAGSRQIELADMNRNLRIKNNRYSRWALRGTGVKRVDIAALQARCQWPEGAS
jgi:hypothetical protein